MLTILSSGRLKGGKRLILLRDCVNIDQVSLQGRILLLGEGVGLEVTLNNIKIQLIKIIETILLRQLKDYKQISHRFHFSYQIIKITKLIKRNRLSIKKKKNSKNLLRLCIKKVKVWEVFTTI